MTALSQALKLGQKRALCMRPAEHTVAELRLCAHCKATVDLIARNNRRGVKTKPHRGTRGGHGSPEWRANISKAMKAKHAKRRECAA